MASYGDIHASRVVWFSFAKVYLFVHNHTTQFFHKQTFFFPLLDTSRKIIIYKIQILQKSPFFCHCSLIRKNTMNGNKVY